MADIEKVVVGIEHCDKLGCSMCPYKPGGYSPMDCRIQLMRDALELLKEQEAVVPLTIDDAVSEIIDKHYKRLKEQETVEAKQGEWIYCEDASGQDGYKCSECGFFEPWYYDFENHNFITDYAYCPSCGRSLQEGR